jgi:hypothetical protein
MARIALLSNPRSTGNRSLLPRVRSFCDRHHDIFHYEVDQVDQIGAALKTIARVQPRVLVINGGDGTVQATLTEMFNGGHFGDNPPPVAVLPNGKTNLIAHDLGAEGDPIEALARYLEIARSDLGPHIVTRELISLTGGTRIGKPVVGMFLGGAGLANTMLYCRNKLYPLGLPNGIAHFIAFFAGLLSIGIGRGASFLPAGPSHLTVSMEPHDQLKGRFAILMVTTLEQVLLKTQVGVGKAGVLKLLVVERRPMTIVRGFIAAIFGRLGRQRLRGLHLERSDEIRIEGGDGSNVILDGELYSARTGRPIILTSTPPVPFLKLAA